MTKFNHAVVKHVPREHNMQVDVLLKLVSTRKKGREEICDLGDSPPSKHEETRKPARGKHHRGKQLLDDPNVQFFHKGRATL